MEPQEASNQTNQPVHNNHKLLMGGVVIGLLVSTVFTIIYMQSQQSMNYRSEAVNRVYPTQARIPSPSVPPPTVTPGRINSKDGLMNALEELENENATAESEIQQLINSLNETP